MDKKTAIKLLLTSAGFLNKEVANVFLKLINKPVEKIKMIFIPTASRNKEELHYVKLSFDELIELGIKKENIKELNLDHFVKIEEIDGYDTIYVCGGNTFYLLKKIRGSGFDKILSKFKGVYVGVSAGSIVVGPNIEVSAPWDPNDVNLADTTGLNLVDFAVSPHYQNKEKSIIENIQKKVNYEIIPLTDNQAALVESGERKIIGNS